MSDPCRGSDLETAFFVVVVVVVVVLVLVLVPLRSEFIGEL